jgi:hypothetical protein
MNAHHYKAAYWVGQGVFDGLTSFTEFESRVNDIFEEKDRGDVFEIFIEGYLATQAITQHTEHWVVGGIISSAACGVYFWSGCGRRIGTSKRRSYGSRRSGLNQLQEALVT